MPSPFENLTGPGKPLKVEPPDAKEFAGLKRAGLARLLDASNAPLALESRFACRAGAGKVEAVGPIGTNPTALA